MKEWKKFLLMVAVFAGCFYLPLDLAPFRNPVFEALALVKWYAREHVLFCLVPAFFIAGAISVFVNQSFVIKYLGAKANKFLAYGVASVSGAILTVCSCTVLPLFSGIYKRGAGLGPATAFLYSGPAINVLAIIFTVLLLLKIIISEFQFRCFKPSVPWPFFISAVVCGTKTQQSPGGTLLLATTSIKCFVLVLSKNCRKLPAAGKF